MGINVINIMHSFPCQFTYSPSGEKTEGATRFIFLVPLPELSCKPIKIIDLIDKDIDFRDRRAVVWNYEKTDPRRDGGLIMPYRKYTKLIMVGQTLIALPIAYLGILFAGGGDLLTWLWVSLGLVAGRTAGMSFNRVIDAEIDARNPRTRDRSIPSGELTPRQVWILAAVSCAVLIFSSYMLNHLCFVLSFIIAALLFFYSYFKRFTPASHLYFGFIEATAPIGGYIAVTGTFIAGGRPDLVPVFLGAAIMLWIAGLDIIKSISDIEFDRNEGLFSIPVKYGREKSLSISLALYLAGAVSLVLAGILARRGMAYWVTLVCVVIIFIYQQRTARLLDQDAAVKEISRLNALVAPALFAGTFLDVFAGM